MIKHIVLFNFLDNAEGRNKTENLAIAKEMLEALPQKIKEIKYYEVGINQKESERAADLSLISDFDSWDDLNTYIKHPEHQKVVEFILKVRDHSRAVDYEF